MRKEALAGGNEMLKFISYSNHDANMANQAHKRSQGSGSPQNRFSPHSLMQPGSPGQNLLPQLKQGPGSFGQLPEFKRMGDDAEMN
jgi:hypothetical protein